MQALMKRWNCLAADDRELFAVHEVGKAEGMLTEYRKGLKFGLPANIHS
jgi:hypothetical protein